MIQAPVLRAWLDAAGGGRVAACEAAARVASDLGGGWCVVEQAGALARARLVLATERVGVSGALRAVDPGSSRAVAVVEAGQAWPTWDRSGRRGAGAYDTPREMARAVVRAALDAAGGEATSGLDPACGPGAFLVALAEAGVPRVRGVELEPAAAAVARIAVPGADVRVADALGSPLRRADLVVGNPPFVPPERQSRALRDSLIERYPWLSGRFDLAVPFAAAAVEAADLAAALVLPAALLSQPYGAPLRRAWLGLHRVASLERRAKFPGASVPVALLSLSIGAGPGPVSPSGVPAATLLRLRRTPLDPCLRMGDVEAAEAVRAASAQLGDFCEVDTGVVAHGPLGGKGRLVRDEHEPGARPYVDARDFFSGRRRWIHYRPDEMHRPKRPALFADGKLLVQRLIGAGGMRAGVDREGLIAGHTLTVVRPLPGCPLSLEQLLEALMHPSLGGVIRVEQGARLDLYPKDVRGWPLPRSWLEDTDSPLDAAMGLTTSQAASLAALSRAR